MKIHHLRNATLIIEVNKYFILIDPMLGKRGSNIPLAFLRHRAKRNPIVNLPENADDILKKVTHCLITHCQKKHFDHLDKEGELFLIKNKIPVICNEADFNYLKKRNIKVQQKLTAWKTTDFLDGKITAVPAKHGYNWVHKLMANGFGYVIEFPNAPSIYISGDTIYTENVDKALKKFQPKIAIVAAGSASFDIGKPILMHLDDIVKFVKNAPNKVIANHLEALNHCPTTRNELKVRFKKEAVLEKVLIPNDGDCMDFTNLN